MVVEEPFIFVERFGSNRDGRGLDARLELSVELGLQRRGGDLDIVALSWGSWSRENRSKWRAYSCASDGKRGKCADEESVKHHRERPEGKY